MKEINSLTVNSSTFIPKKMGINNDDRTLGIDVVNFMVE
jgi:hypothetical protein